MDTAGPSHLYPSYLSSIIANNQTLNCIVTFTCEIISPIQCQCKGKRKQCLIHKTMSLTGHCTDPLSYGFWLRLLNLLTNLLFLRIEAFWGGQLCCLQIGLFGSYHLKENVRIRKKIRLSVN